jgi:hypothetical protein
VSVSVHGIRLARSRCCCGSRSRPVPSRSGVRRWSICPVRQSRRVRLHPQRLGAGGSSSRRTGDGIPIRPDFGLRAPPDERGVDVLLVLLQRDRAWHGRLERSETLCRVGIVQPGGLWCERMAKRPSGFHRRLDRTHLPIPLLGLLRVLGSTNAQPDVASDTSLLGSSDRRHQFEWEEPHSHSLLTPDSSPSRNTHSDDLCSPPYPRKSWPAPRSFQSTLRHRRETTCSAPYPPLPLPSATRGSTT